MFRKRANVCDIPSRTESCETIPDSQLEKFFLTIQRLMKDSEAKYDTNNIIAASHPLLDDAFEVEKDLARVSPVDFHA